MQTNIKLLVAFSILAILVIGLACDPSDSQTNSTNNTSNPTGTSFSGGAGTGVGGSGGVGGLAGVAGMGGSMGGIPGSAGNGGGGSGGSPVWNIATTSDVWDVVYDGFGSVNFGTSSGVVLQPKTATVPSETHAALALAKVTESCPVKDFRLTLAVTTNQQLRLNSAPNDWEVFWIFFNYLPQGSDKTTNYFMMKVGSGIELGTAFGSVGQTFLATPSSPSLQIGKQNTFVIDKTGQNLKVFIDGTQVLNFQGVPNDLYDQAGSIGLYTEDAKVTVKSVILEPRGILSGVCP